MQKVEIPEIYISLYSSSYNKQIVVDLRRYNNFGRPHLIYLNLYEPTDLHDIWKKRVTVNENNFNESSRY